MNVTPAADSASVSWAATPGAQGYAVYLDDVKVATVTGLTYALTGLAPGSSHVVAVRPIVEGAGESASFTVPAASVALRIVCGPNQVAAPSGPAWQSDRMVSGGAQDSTTATIATAGVTNAAPAAVYQRERWGAFTYVLTGLTAGAVHTVRLHMAETYYSAAGKRVVTVTVNGAQALIVDPYAAAGRLKAVVRDITATADAQGRIILGFTATPGGDATLAGIEVLTTAVAPPAPTPPVASAWPSGLPFGSGAYVENDVGRLAAMGAWRGARMDINVEFTQRDTWPNVLNPWWDIRQDADTRLSLAVPLWPEDCNVAAAANGEYDGYWRQLAALLRDGDRLRLGWEMNMPMWHWQATPGNLTQWRQAWTHAYDAIKATRPGLVVVYNPGADAPAGQTGLSDIRHTIVEGKLDVIALDIYDWWPGTTSDAIWQDKLNAPGYLNWWLDEAKARGLKFALCEWAVAADDGENNAAGDNPRWIRGIYEWLSANRDWIDHETYFDETSWGGFGVYPGGNPNSAAEYLRQIDALR